MASSAASSITLALRCFISSHCSSLVSVVFDLCGMLSRPESVPGVIWNLREVRGSGLLSFRPCFRRLVLWVEMSS